MDAILIFAETQLLWMVAVFSLTGIALRSLFFFFSVLRRRPLGRRGIVQRFVTLFGLLIPFHRAVLKKPAYTSMRYAFHTCIFIVPIWFSGHVSLWEESGFQWYWTPLPDEWADWMTLFVLAACACFILRRIILKNRLDAGISDFMLILLTGLPFLTGYLYTHGTLDAVPFFEEYMYYGHVISAEIMLAVIVFLFLTTRLKKKTCVGCGACVENCPSETLEFSDKGALRFFRYSHYQCICCGSCVNACPENAASLGHSIGLKHLFRVFSKDVIRNVDLGICNGCGSAMAPQPQLVKLEVILSENDAESALLYHCNRCKKKNARKSALFPAAWDPVTSAHLSDKR